MEKECCEMKFCETDEGFTIEVMGKTLKEAFCCMPMFAGMKASASKCCPSEEEKK